VASAAVLWFLDNVGVMSASFDNAWVRSVSPAFGASFVDLIHCFGEGLFPTIRGKSPPAR
jgi:hypothetical protein